MKPAKNTNPKRLSRRQEIKQKLLADFGIDLTSNLVDDLLYEFKLTVNYSNHKLIDELLTDTSLMCDFVEFVLNETEE